MSKMVKILSIDGGGMRGIIPATILAEIEKRTHKPISKLFDLIAGTSTGGILTLGMVKPDAHGLPAYTAQQGIELYEREGERIFTRSIWHRIHAIDNATEEKYPSSGIETVLDEYFGETRLKDALTDVLITSYDIERRMAFFFKSRKAKQDPAYDFPMKKVARATSAAPTYFEPLKLEANTPDEYYPLVDGGVHSNNPAMCAFAEAKAAFKDADDFLLVSIGTGQMTRPILYDKAKDWGLVGWVRPLIEVMFDGMINTVDYELQQFLPDRNGVKRYYRLQARLDEKTSEIDDTDHLTVRALKLLAEGVIQDNDKDLTALCSQLVF
jgi:patatin-like phospholipase/acyl hydrolase